MNRAWLIKEIAAIALDTMIKGKYIQQPVQAANTPFGQL